MTFRQRQVDAWLELRRREPSIPVSVTRWLAMQERQDALQRQADARQSAFSKANDVVLGINRRPPKKRAPPLSSNSQRQSIFFDVEVLEEIRSEAKRMGRPFSKVVQYAWAIAREQVRTFKTHEQETKP